jgi:superfamily II DNA or RNA helicase
MHLSSAGYVVDKRRLPMETRQEIRRELSLVPKVDTNYTNGRSPPAVHAFEEDHNTMTLPKLYGVRRFGKASWSDGEGVPVPGLRFNGALKQTQLVDQFEACAAVQQAFHDHGGGVLSLPTGSGKTACALWLASQLGLRTAVVVHSDMLLKQWRERIQFFLPEASIGEVRGSTEDTEHDVVICMLQSLTMHAGYGANLLSGCGLVILDEAHHVAARVFQRVFRMATRPYTLGLSATPTRSDGLDVLLEHFIGPMAYKVEMKVPDGVLVETVEYDDAWPEEVPATRNGNVNLPQVINYLSNHEERTEMILEIIRGKMSEGREILVLSDRREHCMAMHSMLGCPGKSVVFIGGIHPDVIEDKQVIFATYQLCAEGFDCPRLSTLIMATPRSNVIQSCGRVMRTGDARKHHSLIVDIVDTWAVLRGSAAKRSLYYRKAGFGGDCSSGEKRFPETPDEISAFFCA